MRPVDSVRRRAGSGMGKFPIFAIPRAELNDQVVTGINTDVNPLALFTELAGPVGTDIQNLLELSAIQLGGLFTAEQFTDSRIRRKQPRAEALMRLWN